MELLYSQNFKILTSSVDRFGRLKPAIMLSYIQEVAGVHGSALGASFEALAQRGLFWAIIRQKIQVTRMPEEGETIRLETWAMPATRTYFPRSTVAYDAEGNEVFRSLSMWVLMDMESRSMVLPGKSGVEVQGRLTGSELKAPGSLSLRNLAHTTPRRVGYSDLDCNGHMNNTRCLEWISDLLPSSFHENHVPGEIVVCYYAEGREGEILDLHWQMPEDAAFQVDAFRQGDDPQRVFAVQIRYEQLSTE